MYLKVYEKVSHNTRASDVLWVTIASAYCAAMRGARGRYEVDCYSDCVTCLFCRSGVDDRRKAGRDAAPRAAVAMFYCTA